MSTTRWIATGICLLCLGLAPSAGCAESDAGGSADSAAGAGGVAGAMIDASFGGTNTGGGGVGGNEVCVGESYSGQRVPVSLHVMQDISGSMTESTASGKTKWEVMTAAIKDFTLKPPIDQVSASVRFFPKPTAGPLFMSCKTNADCGVYGPCVYQVCETAMRSCKTTPCPSGDLCATMQGLCSEFHGCKHWTQDYSQPVVPMTALPAGAGAIAQAYDQVFPIGGTPLQYAITHIVASAKDYAKKHPDERSAIVLATDGRATLCSINIEFLQQLLGEALPDVMSFVIGVVAPSDALTNLNALAMAGGTQKAYLVSDQTDIGQQLAGALNQIGQALTCEYALPTPDGGQSLDYGKVNVRFSANGETTDILFVKDASGCDGQAGGWYYDVDPASAAPQKIVVCPTTCQLFGTANGGQVDIELGCKTKVPTVH